MRHARRQQIAQDAAKERATKTTRGRALISGLAAFCIAGALAFSGYQLVVHDETPLPRAWNPIKPLVISDQVTPLTGWKLRRAANDFDTCLATLAGAAALQVLPARRDSAQCYIADRVSLRQVGQASLAPVETRCAIALRMAVWEKHTLQPAAIEHLGTSVDRIAHIGSYSCRNLRTDAGTSARISTHATADAIDIAGFELGNGAELRLLRDWDTDGPRAAFLRAARDGACDWFDLTLSPDYNRLHADHFHLQSTGWGGCR